MSGELARDILPLHRDSIGNVIAGQPEEDALKLQHAGEPRPPATNVCPIATPSSLTHEHESASSGDEFWVPGSLRCPKHRCGIGLGVEANGRLKGTIGNSESAALSDSDDEFLRDLFTAHQGRGDAAASNSDSDTEFLTQLLTDHRSERCNVLDRASASSRSSVATTSGVRIGVDDERSDDVAHGSSAIGTAGPSVVAASCRIGRVHNVNESNSKPEPAPVERRCRGRGGKFYLLPLRPEVVLDLQDQHARVMTRVPLYPCISAALCRKFIDAKPSDLAPSSLDSLASSLALRISGMVTGIPPSTFKIGITSDPVWRFHEAPFAYAKSGDYAAMEVLLVAWPILCGFLERSLIGRMQGVQGLQNIAPGGESLPPSGTICYLYMTHNCVDALISDRLHAIRRRLAW